MYGVSDVRSLYVQYGVVGICWLLVSVGLAVFQLGMELLVLRVVAVLPGVCYIFTDLLAICPCEDS